MHGNPYGWGIAIRGGWGADVTQGTYCRDLEESRERIINHLGALYPEAFDDNLAKPFDEPKLWRKGSIDDGS